MPENTTKNSATPAAEPKKLARFFEIKSFTQKDVTYTVRRMPDDTWHCSCPQGVFNRLCKHILLAQQMDAYPHDKVKWAIARAELMARGKVIQ